MAPTKKAKDKSPSSGSSGAQAKAGAKAKAFSPPARKRLTQNTALPRATLGEVVDVLARHAGVTKTVARQVLTSLKPTYVEIMQNHGSAPLPGIGVVKYSPKFTAAKNTFVKSPFKDEEVLQKDRPAKVRMSPHRSFKNEVLGLPEQGLPEPGLPEP